MSTFHGFIHKVPAGGSTLSRSAGCVSAEVLQVYSRELLMPVRRLVLNAEVRGVCPECWRKKFRHAHKHYIHTGLQCAVVASSTGFFLFSSLHLLTYCSLFPFLQARGHFYFPLLFQIKEAPSECAGIMFYAV